MYKVGNTVVSRKNHNKAFIITKVTEDSYEFECLISDNKYHIGKRWTKDKLEVEEKTRKVTKLDKALK